MRRRGQFGYLVLTLKQKPGIRRPGQWLPRKSEAYWMPWKEKLLLLQWQPHRGIYPDAFYVKVGYDWKRAEEFPNLWSQKMKKVSIGLEPGQKLPPLSDESVVLKRFPLIRFFLTSTSYEDGSPRAPGRIWLDNDGTGFRITLFEPSAFARVPLRASNLDDVFAMWEAFLKLENAPWEADQYARDKAAEKLKKKK